MLREQAPDEHLGQLARRRKLVIGDTRLAVDSESEGHLAGGNVKQRVGGTRQGAAVKGYSEGTGRQVRFAGQTLNLSKVESGIRCRAGDLEHREVPRDAASFVDLGQRGAGNVISNDHCASGDTLRVQAFLSLTEVQHVAGIVAVAQEHSTAGVGGLGHPVDLASRWRRKHIAAGRAGGQALADHSGEGRVMPRTSPDDQSNLVGVHFGGAHNAAVDAGHVAAVSRDKAR